MAQNTEKKRILIVDDEPKIGKILGLKLKIAGYDVVSTTSGAEAVEFLRNEKFDGMLLDILMPEMSGLDVLNQVRTFSQIPVIVFTAKPGITEIARKMGANDSISKPLNPDFLIAKIKTVLGGNSTEAPRPSL